MAIDLAQVTALAEAEIQKRNRERQSMQLDFRGPAALEIQADEMTRIRAEMHILRVLFATYAASAARR